MLALLIEVVSIKVAGKQIKKPIDIPRPGKKGKGGQQQQGEDAKGRPLMTPPAPPSRQQAQARQHDAERDAKFKQGISVLQKSARPRR